MSFGLSNFSTADECLTHTAEWLSQGGRTSDEVQTLIKEIEKRTGEKVGFFQNAMGIIQNDKGEILLLKRRKDAKSFPDSFSFPGGRLDKNDKNLEHAMTRETLEETGLHSKIQSIHSIRYTNVPHRKCIFEVAIYFLAVTSESENQSVQLSDEHVEYIWASPKTILSAPDMYVLSGSIIKELIQELAQKSE